MMHLTVYKLKNRVKLVPLQLQSPYRIQALLPQGPLQHVGRLCRNVWDFANMKIQLSCSRTSLLTKVKITVCSGLKVYKLGAT